MEAQPEKLLLWGALLAVLVVTLVYVIGKLRAEPAQQEPTAGELLSNFRELHSWGGLSDEEFRTIKTTLAVQFQEELKGDGEKGCDE
ncbi:MAG TPA: hypothetical protein VMY42_17410 [Thermoguttaceae bacterium]|nr:hypothetical protein [Thermoguttaceae bacterium]